MYEGLVKVCGLHEVMLKLLDKSSLTHTTAASEYIKLPKAYAVGLLIHSLHKTRPSIALHFGTIFKTLTQLRTTYDTRRGVSLGLPHGSDKVFTATCH